MVSTKPRPGRHWGRRGINSGEGEKRIGNKCEIVLRCSKVNAPPSQIWRIFLEFLQKKILALPQAVLFSRKTTCDRVQIRQRFSNCVTQRSAECVTGRRSFCTVPTRCVHMRCFCTVRVSFHFVAGAVGGGTLRPGEGGVAICRTVDAGRDVGALAPAGSLTWPPRRARSPFGDLAETLFRGFAP